MLQIETWLIKKVKKKLKGKSRLSYFLIATPEMLSYHCMVIQQIIIFPGLSRLSSIPQCSLSFRFRSSIADLSSGGRHSKVSCSLHFG